MAEEQHCMGIYSISDRKWQPWHLVAGNLCICVCPRIPVWPKTMGKYAYHLRHCDTKRSFCLALICVFISYEVREHFPKSTTFCYTPLHFNCSVPVIVNWLNSVSRIVSITGQSFLFFLLRHLYIHCIIAFLCHVVEPASETNVTCTHVRNEAPVSRYGRHLIQTLTIC